MSKGHGMIFKFLAVTAILLLAFTGQAFAQAPDTPVLSSPSHGQVVGGSTVVLEWEAPAGADVYVLYVWDLTGGVVEVVVDNELVSDTSYTLDELSDEGDVYAWTVAAGKTGEGFSDWAVPIAFVNGTDKDIYPPTLTAPAHSSNAAGTSVNLQWDAPAAADAYVVMVWMYTEDEGYVTVINNESTSDTSYTLSGLSDDGDQYAWTVAAGNSATVEWSDWAFPWVFTNGEEDAPSEHSIHNIVFDPVSPATLEFGENVNFTFDYSTTNPGNVRIWGSPMTEGELSPNRQGHGSLQHSPPEGSGSGFIRIQDVGQTDAQHVDQVRFRMECVDTNTTLLVFFVDVDYTYEPPSEHAIHNIVITPTSPATLEFEDRVEFTFDYSTTNPEDVRLFGTPITAGSVTPNTAMHGSVRYNPPSGSGSGWFTVRDLGQTDTQTVDQIRFRMRCAETDNVLTEFFVDVDYTYEPPSDPAAFLSGYEEVVHDMEITANETLSYNMPSPEGKVPLNGGTNVLGTAAHDVVICAMSPYFLGGQVAGWRVEVKNNGSGTHTVRVRGIFADPPPGYEIYTEDFLVGYDPRSTVRNDLLIPADKIIISGGASPVGVGWDFRMLESGPISEGDQHGWRVRMLNMGDSDYTVRMYAITANPLAGYEQVPNDVTIPFGETRDVHIYAPDDKVIIGGGMTLVSGGTLTYIRDMSPMHPMAGTTDGFKASIRNFSSLYDSNIRVTAIFAEVDDCPG